MVLVHLPAVFAERCGPGVVVQEAHGLREALRPLLAAAVQLVAPVVIGHDCADQLLGLLSADGHAAFRLGLGLLQTLHHLVIILAPLLVLRGSGSRRLVLRGALFQAFDGVFQENGFLLRVLVRHLVSVKLPLALRLLVGHEADHADGVARFYHFPDFFPVLHHLGEGRLLHQLLPQVQEPCLVHDGVAGLAALDHHKRHHGGGHGGGIDLLVLQAAHVLPIGFIVLGPENLLFLRLLFFRHVASPLFPEFLLFVFIRFRTRPGEPCRSRSRSDSADSGRSADRRSAGPGFAAPGGPRSPPPPWGRS